jgi:hypothetical protein
LVYLGSASEASSFFLSRLVPLAEKELPSSRGRQARRGNAWSSPLGEITGDRLTRSGPEDLPAAPFFILVVVLNLCRMPARSDVAALKMHLKAFSRTAGAGVMPSNFDAARKSNPVDASLAGIDGGCLLRVSDIRSGELNHQMVVNVNRFQPGPFQTHAIALAARHRI